MQQTKNKQTGILRFEFNPNRKSLDHTAAKIHKILWTNATATELDSDKNKQQLQW